MKILSLLTLFIGFSLNAQVSKAITIESPAAKPITVTYENLKTYHSHTLDSLQILNHLKQYKSTLKNIKGVLLKDILAKAPFGEESPKILSEYYIVCIANDNYKVVFSWNELFNSPTGEHVLVVTDINGIATTNQKEGIQMVTPTDVATGRRYVKNLKTIRIERVK